MFICLVRPVCYIQHQRILCSISIHPGEVFIPFSPDNQKHLKVFDSHTKIIGSMYYFCIIAQEYEKLAQNSTAIQGKRKPEFFVLSTLFNSLAFLFSSPFFSPV